MHRRKWISYSKDELAWIKRNRAWPRKKAHKKFCEFFGRKDVKLIHYNALCKRKGWLTGRTGCFEKGIIPANTGKKCPPGKMGNHPNARKTQFKKGQTPITAKYVGHERIDRKDGYVWLSVAEKNPHTGAATRYVLKHKYLWEKKNGKVPAGHFLKCLDGNRANTDPSNWKLMPRSAQPFLGGFRGRDYEKTPKELKPTVLALALVKAAKGKALKRGKPQ